MYAQCLVSRVLLYIVKQTRAQAARASIDKTEINRAYLVEFFDFFGNTVETFKARRRVMRSNAFDKSIKKLRVPQSSQAGIEKPFLDRDASFIFIFWAVGGSFSSL